MKSKSQQRREAVLKTGKLPAEKWKPKDGERFYAIELCTWIGGDRCTEAMCANLSRFRTKALGLAALRKVKKVLKEAKHG